MVKTLENALRIAQSAQSACGHKRAALSRRGWWTQHYAVENGEGFETDSPRRLGCRWLIRCLDCGEKASGKPGYLPEWAERAVALAEEGPRDDQEPTSEPL